MDTAIIDHPNIKSTFGMTFENFNVKVPQHGLKIDDHIDGQVSIHIRRRPLEGMKPIFERKEIRKPQCEQREDIVSSNTRLIPKYMLKPAGGDKTSDGFEEIDLPSNIIHHLNEGKLISLSNRFIQLKKGSNTKNQSNQIKSCKSDHFELQKQGQTRSQSVHKPHKQHQQVIDSHSYDRSHSQVDDHFNPFYQVESIPYAYRRYRTHRYEHFSESDRYQRESNHFNDSHYKKRSAPYEKKTRHSSNSDPKSIEQLQILDRSTSRGHSRSHQENEITVTDHLARNASYFLVSIRSRMQLLSLIVLTPFYSMMTDNRGGNSGPVSQDKDQTGPELMVTIIFKIA